MQTLENRSRAQMTPYWRSPKTVNFGGFFIDFMRNNKGFHGQPTMKWCFCYVFDMFIHLKRCIVHCSYRTRWFTKKQHILYFYVREFGAWNIHVVSHTWIKRHNGEKSSKRQLVGEEKKKKKRGNNDARKSGPLIIPKNYQSHVYLYICM